MNEADLTAIGILALFFIIGTIFFGYVNRGQ
jgi:hypothetical protein